MSRHRPHPVHRCTAAYRRLVARRPWVHWVAVASLAVATGAQLLARDDRVDQARAAWGTTRTVLVTDRPVAPGEPIVATVRAVPVAFVPAAALDPDTAAHIGAARQHLSAGEVVTVLDVATGGPLPLLPDGWLAVPIVESPPSGATVGHRVQIASDGVVVADDAVVVGRFDDVTLVGVPAELAAGLPPAAGEGGLVVLRRP